MSAGDVKDTLEFKVRYSIDELQTCLLLFRQYAVIDGLGTPKSLNEAVQKLRAALSEALDVARPGGSKERMAHAYGLTSPLNATTPSEELKRACDDIVRALRAAGLKPAYLMLREPTSKKQKAAAAPDLFSLAV